MSNQDMPQLDAWPFARREGSAIIRTDFDPLGGMEGVGGLDLPFEARQLTTPYASPLPNMVDPRTEVGGGRYD